MSTDLWTDARQELDGVLPPTLKMHHVVRRSRRIRLARNGLAAIAAVLVVVAVAGPALLLSGIRPGRPARAPVLGANPPPSACPEPSFGCPDVAFAQEIADEAGLDRGDGGPSVPPALTSVTVHDQGVTYLLWTLHAEDDEHRVRPLARVLDGEVFVPRTPVAGAGLFTDGNVVVWQVGVHYVFFDRISTGQIDENLGTVIRASRRVNATDVAEDEHGPEPTGKTYVVVRRLGFDGLLELRAYRAGGEVCFELAHMSGSGACGVPPGPSGDVGFRALSSQEGLALPETVVYGPVWKGAAKVEMQLRDGRRFASQVYRHPRLPTGFFLIRLRADPSFARITVYAKDGSILSRNSGVG